MATDELRDMADKLLDLAEQQQRPMLIALLLEDRCTVDVKQGGPEGLNWSKMVASVVYSLSHQLGMDPAEFMARLVDTMDCAECIGPDVEDDSDEDEGEDAPTTRTPPWLLN
jgi:hypothetical protein